jgi:hypothetical protein
MEIRLAMTMAYLASEGRFQGVASLFGVSKATAITNINEVMDLLVIISPSIVRLVKTWDKILYCDDLLLFL